MQEKTMVADTLTGINGELVRYGGMIAQTENKELKQTLKQFRNACAEPGGALSDCQGEILLCAGCKGHTGRSRSCKIPLHKQYFIGNLSVRR